MDLFAFVCSLVALGLSYSTMIFAKHRHKLNHNFKCIYCGKDAREIIHESNNPIMKLWIPLVRSLQPPNTSFRNQRCLLTKDEERKIYGSNSQEA